MKYSELDRQKKVVEIMSKRIHDYEVESEALKKEITILRNYARGLNHRLDMESFQGKGAQ